MVDGLLVCMDRVVRHVVVEQSLVLDVAVILHLHVKERIVLAQVLSLDHVHIDVVLVRLYYKL